jgi:hypothetical protein
MPGIVASRARKTETPTARRLVESACLRSWNCKWIARAAMSDVRCCFTSSVVSTSTNAMTTSSGCVSAICATMNPCCRRDRLVMDAAAPLSTSDSPNRVACSAGDKPNTTPVPIANSAV